MDDVENSLKMKSWVAVFTGNISSEADKRSPEVLVISGRATYDLHPFGGNTTNPFDKLSINDLRWKFIETSLSKWKLLTLNYVDI